MQLDLDRYVPGLLLWLSNKVSSSASALYHERFGVSVTEWRVLAYFKIHPWSTASKACEFMGLDKAAVSRSVANLVGKNVLEPRPQGLRKIEYRVTAEGNKLHNAMYRFAMAREQALLKGIDDAERAVLIDLLKRMLDNLGEVQQVGRVGRRAPQAAGERGTENSGAMSAPARRVAGARPSASRTQSSGI
ncbi:MarR family winged helix-turn-helix transcriptional regulator [Hydrogenophaga intermedia]|uniref:MarR/EmrR family transcriptional regulator n=1 Tax=Hydrogenophaga intermedia TaxID=65786 RepID=A0A1L1PJV7_HYDIT|nr:MarR family winged helix-turn-helix transcriptional regulator [Hydrogenophaga intermedia]TMU72303.1 winged helix-turn-helix transcriptional regulator [Hydrogenophaga intermedia]CDN89034.1 MarR/EmrR family transcriptional regulator [Hydrogenophaga intermedia]